MDFHGAFSLINEKEEDKYTSIQFGNLFMSFESFMNFTKKIPSLVSLIASIEFNDSFEVEFYI